MLTATRKLLARNGYAELTVNEVAAEAGVSKAAIYRRFGSKAEMAFQAAVHDDAIQLPDDAGSLLDDLRVLTHKILQSMGNPLARASGPALIAELGKDPALAERFRQSLYALELDRTRELLERAVARGELATAPDPELVQLLLAGPIFYALFGFQLPVDENLADRIATVVHAGLSCDE